jgi:hypothetical protein
MFRIRSWVIAISITALIASCKDRKPPPEETSNAGTSPPQTSTTALPAINDVTDKWLGKWIGPEGTYLVLSKNTGKYIVLINSLDGPATYEGMAAGDRIEFHRDGKTETIHAGSGHDTGMKWLLDKSNCLIIKTGEGFCRV